MGYDVLEGALATLKRAVPSAKLAELFQKRPRLRARTGLQQVPDLARLKHLMLEEQALIIWEIHAEGKTDPIGYAGIVTYDGPPYVWLYGLDEAKMPPELGQDIFMLLIPVFFKETGEPELFFFIGRPVPEAVHEMLIEGGFDPLDELPTIDNDSEAAYVLERHTYDAYYGDGAETEDVGGEADDEAAGAFEEDDES